MIKQAKEIYVIGYRARDEVIRDIFEGFKSSTELDIISSNDARDIADHLRGLKAGLHPRNIYNQGFSNFLDSTEIGF
ncbi:MAG: hypothetical protein L0196_07195 [candidate division Zixibacteria bacterium]|nr:hypothetical protein [candidate division Zixibacteria bacterium]